jgi:hypothetical protein
MANTNFEDLHQGLFNRLVDKHKMPRGGALYETVYVAIAALAALDALGVKVTKERMEDAIASATSIVIGDLVHDIPRR